MRTTSKLFSALSFGLLFQLSLFVASDAHAVGTRTFELDSQEEFAAGELKGVSVSSDGSVRPSVGLSSIPLTDATATFATLVRADGSVLIGTSPGGKVFEVQGGVSKVFADTGALAVTSLVEWNKSVYAATIPDGKIFKITQGKAELFAQLPEASHVWALVVDKTSLVAATGPDGKVFRIDAGGKSNILYKSEEPNIVSLAVAPNGDVYAGSSGKGILYKISAPGKASVVYDFPGEEVKAIAVDKNGQVFAIGNEYGEPPDVARRTSGRAAPGPVAPAKLKPGKGQLMRFDAQGKPEKMMNHNEFHYLSLALGPDGKAYVGAGAEGRVYSVDDGHNVTLVADTDERQISTLGFTGNNLWLTGSDSAVYHRAISGGGESIFTSKALDAGLRAKFGQASWTSSGGIEITTRTGFTQTPDATWSGWSSPLGMNQVVQSPAGRFIQVRARLRADGVIQKIALPFVTDNVRAVVTEVSAQPKSGPKETKEGIQTAQEVPKHDTGLKVSWKVENPDTDLLRYRVSFKREGQTLWRDMLRENEVLSKLETDWETLAIPDGKYRVRVEASDELANPPQQVEKHSLESNVVTVDNTPPTMPELSVQGRKLRVHVVDALSTIARAEVAIDGRPEWRVVSPVDGVFDSVDERIDTDLTSMLPAGPHIVAVRAYDSVGNVVIKETEAQ